VVRVAKLSGVAESNIDRIEDGGAPNLLNALKYARFLHLPVEEIWGLKQEKD
jgi:DNA-binding XRE family transcriptional regulator